MGGWLSRRRVLALLAGALGAAPASAATQETPTTSREQCSWRRVQGPLCSGGRTKEYWCERCCDPTGCQTVRCEWRVVGSC